MNNEIEEILPMNLERSFHVRVEDKYHRSYITYDGLKNVHYKFGGKKTTGGWIERDLPEEDLPKVMDKYNELKAFAEEYYPENEPNPSAQQYVSIGPEENDNKHFMELDKEALEMAFSIEQVFMERYPEIKANYDEAVNNVNIFAEQSRIEEMRKNEARLAFKEFKEEHPELFYEDGNFKKEAIDLISNLINNYTNQEENTSVMSR